MDTTLKLAFSIYNNPGVYAVLLGSGISRAAGIPTGWEIAQDLNRQIKDAGSKGLSEDAGYDEMLKALGNTKAERNAILQRYFEPSNEEREQGIKIPTTAHRAIAQLIKDQYIRVVLTTNFDRLIEIALEEIGITPNVIRSDDMMEGAPPIRHSPIAIIQLHGDYRDIRTLNTAEELDKYTDAKNRLLATIFDEYGLIICGWSATWDTALRNSLLRAKPRWYSTFWVEPNTLSDTAQDVIKHRSAEIVKENADAFFTTLQGQVMALEKINREHPLSIAVAVERIKKLIPRSDMKIELEDLVRTEADRAYEAFTAIELGDFELITPEEYGEFYKERFAVAFAETETVLNMMAAMCWYGDESQSDLIAKILSKWGQPRDHDEEMNKWRKMPALVFMYVSGLASVMRDKWNYLQAATVEPKIISPHSQKVEPLFDFINKYSAFDYQAYKQVIEDYDPVTKIISDQIRPIFKTHVSGDREFRRWFDLYEHVLAVIALKDKRGWLQHNAALPGYAGYEVRDFIAEFYRSGARKGKSWGFLGLFFEGDVRKLQEVLEQYREYTSKKSIWSYNLDAIPDYFAAYTGKITNS